MARIWMPGLSVFEASRKRDSLRLPDTMPKHRLEAVLRKMEAIESRRFAQRGDREEHAALQREKLDLAAPATTAAPSTQPQRCD